MMAGNSLDLRRRRYFEMSARIAQIENAWLRPRFEAGEPGGGWGRNHTLDIGGCPVFVKRLPITDLEFENLFSTRNLYGLPPYYHYGVGSVGFGVFREFVAHVKTTNAVLDGRIENFPLLYHYRVVPFWGERAAEVDRERHNGYVAYWGGDENMGRYLLDRAAARHELVLFLEHVPHVLQPWLLENSDKVGGVLDDLRRAVSFLRENGVIHFDAHFHNVLIDGVLAYLTDFGLVLDKGFDLAADEAAFFDAHTHYDDGEVLSCLSYPVYQAYEALPGNDKRRLAERYGLPEAEGDADFGERIPLLLDNIEALHADGLLKLDTGYLDAVVRYRGVITLMNDFYTTLRRNPRKDTPFPHDALRRLLEEAGFV